MQFAWFQQRTALLTEVGQHDAATLDEHALLAHYIHPITLDEIAAEVGMNRSSFCIWFKRQKGITFTQFVIQYRLNTAATMLRNSHRQVSEICNAVGFGDLLHFTRAFTKQYGVPPSEYRKEHHEYKETKDDQSIETTFTTLPEY